MCWIEHLKSASNFSSEVKETEGEHLTDGECSLAESYVNGVAREAGAAAEVAASRKEKKYADLDSRYVFEPIAVETLGVLNSSTNSLLKEIGNKIS